MEMDEFKSIVLYSALGVGAATGLFFGGRYIIRRGRANAAERTSLDEGDPSTFAKQLKMAFDNDNWGSWGTDEGVIFSVFREIPSKAIYSRVQRAYQSLYNQNLNRDLEEELSSDEYNQVIRILNAKT